MDQKLDTLYSRYEYLQQLYYEMYIDSYISPICPNPDPSWENLPPVRWCFYGSDGLVKGEGVSLFNPRSNRSSTCWRGCGIGDKCKLYLKLYTEFKSVCKLLNKIKTLLEEKPCNSVHLLGSEEINVLLNYKDIKTFFDDNPEIYSFIDSNYV
jgi:hypothetical protein